MTREKAKLHLIELSLTCDNVLAELPTGYGKTLMGGIELINLHRMGGKFLWVVPEIPLIETAKEEFVKWGFTHLLPHGTFICYNSLHHYLNEEFDCVVLDEVHNGSSECRLEWLKNLKAKKVFALSATIEDTFRDVLLSIRGTWGHLKVTLEEAVRSGVTPEPTIKIVREDLDDSIKRNTFKFKKKEMYCTDRGYYDYISKSITYWKDRYEESHEYFAQLRMKNLGSQRQQFLAHTKTERLKKCLEWLGEERYICFCGSVAQAKMVGGKNVCSSKTTSKQNDLLIEQFNSGKISNIFAKNMLREGINLVDTRYGIIVQLGSKERATIQMVGRMVRSEDGQVFIFIKNDTVDERFLRESFKNNKTLLTK